MDLCGMASWSTSPRHVCTSSCMNPQDAQDEQKGSGKNWETMIGNVKTWWNWCGSSVDKEENCLAVTLRCLVHEEYCLTAKLDSVEMFSSDLYSGTEPFAIGTPNAPGAHVDLQSKKYQPHPPCSDHMLAPHELCSLAVLVSACWS